MMGTPIARAVAEAEAETAAATGCSIDRRPDPRILVNSVLARLRNGRPPRGLTMTVMQAH